MHDIEMLSVNSIQPEIEEQTTVNKELEEENTVNQVKSYLKIFFEISSIHGMNHMVAERRHVFEILLWLTTVLLSVYGVLSLSQTTWTRYQYSPTVVSIDREMYAWNTTFPSLTVCPTRKLSETKLEHYIKNSPETNKDILKEFIVSLTNGTFKTFKNVTDYDKISPHDYMDLILNLTTVFDPILSIGIQGVMITKLPTVTEMGLCYAVNSNVAIYNSPSYRQDNRWDIIETANKTLEIHPLDGEIFAQMMNLTSGYDVYVHGPQEFPDISTKLQRSEQFHYMKLYVNAFTIYTTPNAARLNVNQRRCRFPHENNLKHNPIYSYSLCRMECRIRLCLKYCRCVPHFYRTIDDENICDVKGLKCLSKYEDELYKLQDKNGKNIKCNCLPLCDDVNYVLQSNLLTKWPLGTNLQWGMKTYPRLRYKRDIIFGFTDVLVAVGGMAGLFLGCSVLSFIEIVYFISIHLFFNIRKPKARK